MRRRRNPEIIVGRVNADGSIAVGDGFTVQTAGAGGYNVSLSSTFRVQSVTANTSTGGRTVSVGFAASGVIAITIYVANTLALESNPFSFIAVGVQQ